MHTPDPLAERLPAAFSVAEARALDVRRARLRSAEFRRPFRGVRERSDAAASDTADPYLRRREALVARAHSYVPLLRGSQFFSHETAVALWGGPLPLRAEGRDSPAPVHVSVFGDEALPRMVGVERHRARRQTTTVQTLDGLPLSSPASTWASLGTLPLPDLVALGDYFCRAWRDGFGRPNVGRAPITTIADLRAAVAAGRRVGNPALRAALELIREDSWSPRETQVRLMLTGAGLPEPALNIDIYDERGRFLGCADLAYPEKKIAIEYYGVLHANSYARDVARMAALRG